MFKKRYVQSALFTGFVDYLFVLPILFIAGHFIVGPSILWVWLSLLGLFLVVGILFRATLSSLHWWLYAITALVIGLLTGFIFTANVIFIGLLTLIHTIFIYRGMMYVGGSEKNRIPIPYLWVGGFGIYFVAYFVFRFVDQFQAYLPYITFSGMVLVVITLFMTNRNHLKTATLSKKEEPPIDKEIRSKNRLYLVVTFVIILLLASGQFIQDVLWNGLKNLIQWFSGIQSSPDGELIEDPSPDAGQNPELPFDDGESGIIAKVLEEIVTYALYVVLAVVLIMLILLITKKTRQKMIQIIRGFFRFLKQMVQRKSKPEEQTPYVDEKESIFSWHDWKKDQKQRAKGFLNRFKRGPRWESLSNSEKVRYVYQKLLILEKENFNYQVSDTARETLAKIIATESKDESKVKQLLDAYEETRYGHKKVDDDVTEVLRVLLEKK